MIEPRGMPTTNDTVSPPVMVEIALPRSSGGANPAATAIAVGVNAAAPHAASARHASRSRKVGAKTAAALARAKTAIAATRILRGATPPGRGTSTGAGAAAGTANTVTGGPARSTQTGAAR